VANVSGTYAFAILELVSWRATGDYVTKERCAYIRVSGAAILQKKADGFTKLFEADPVNNQATLPVGRDQSGARQDSEVGGHSILRNIQDTRHVSRGNAIRLVHYYGPERVHPRRLSQRRKGFDCT
jgi:hypothetical protein